MTPKQRRVHNRELALNYARAGIFVLFVKDKTSITSVFQRRDTDISKAERDEVIKTFEQEHGFEPAYVGSTKNISAIKRVFSEHPDAIPAICGGPNNLIILDADIKRDPEGAVLIHGPSALRQWLDDNDTPDHPITKSQSGGEHHFFRDPFGLGNHRGMFKELGTDVRGQGGYVVAQGAIRKDGRFYTPADGTNLIDWIVSGNDLNDDIPEVTAEIVGAIGKRASSEATDEAVAKAKQALHEDLDDTDFDECLGIFDIPYLMKKDAEFKEAWTGANPDGSETLWRIIRGLKREYGDKFEAHHALTAMHLSEANMSYLGDRRKEADEKYAYNDRDVARAYTKACSDDLHPIPSGDAFGDVSNEVDVDDDTDYETRSGMVWSTDLVKMPTKFEWVVKGVIPARGTGTLLADANVGKTGVVIDLAQHLAMNQPWAEHRVAKQGPILYVCGEGFSGVANRLRAIEKHFGTLGGFGVLQLDETNSLFGNKAGAVKRIMAAVKDVEKRSGQKVTMIVLDTLSALSIGMDENSAQDAGVVLGTMRAIERKAECFVLAIHHIGKDKEKGGRGSSALRGNVDTVLTLNSHGGIISLAIDKQRDGAKGLVAKLKLKQIETGVDDDGDPVTSFVIEWQKKKPATTALGDVSAEVDAEEAEVSDGSRFAVDDEESPAGSTDRRSGRSERAPKREPAAEEAEKRQALRAELTSAVRASLKLSGASEVGLADLRGQVGHLDEIMNRGTNVHRAIERAYSLGFDVVVDGSSAIVLDDQGSQLLVMATIGKTKGVRRVFRLVPNPRAAIPLTPPSDDI